MAAAEAPQYVLVFLVKGRFMLRLRLSMALLVCLFALPSGAQETAPETMPDRTSALWLVRSIPTTAYGLSHPSGLAFSAHTGAFLVLDQTGARGASAPTRESLTLLTPRAERMGSMVVAARIPNTLNMTASANGRKLLALDDGGRSLIEARIAPDGPLRNAKRYDLSPFGIQDAQGMTLDPRSGALYVLDASGPQILRIGPGIRRPGAALLVNGIASLVRLDAVDASDLRGLAFNPSNRHLYVLSLSERRLFELTDAGAPVAVYDLNGLSLADPGAMVFAPSGDSTDDPGTMSLYVADGGREDGSARGRLVELSLDPPVSTRTAPLASAFKASVVRTILTSRFSPPSPDPMDLAYDAATNSLVMPDSEVEEMSLYSGVNVWEMSLTGSVSRTSNTRSFSNEPAGLSIDSARGIWYITDDDTRKLFVIDLGSDRRFKTSDDRITSFSTNSFGDDDPESVSFDPVTGHLFFVSGLDAEVYELSPGSNGRFEGSDDQLVRHWDTARYGLRDPESIDVNPESQTLYIASRDAGKIIETTFSGTVVREIDTSAVDGNRPSGLAYAPASNDPRVMHLYIADRGADNDGSPGENDGKIFEITLPGSGTPPPGGGGGSTGGISVAAGSDDAEESSSAGVTLTSSDLELVFDSSNQTVGLRFNGLAIPSGATISNAWIQFHADESQSETTHLTIFGQNVDSAPTFTTSSGNVSSRSRTSHSVTWDPAAWSAGDAGADQKTTNLAPILQEIVNRSSWSSGNSVAFIITGTGHRTAVSFEGDPNAAPVLFVELAAANQAPSVNAGTDQTVTLLTGASLNGTVSDDGLPNPPGRTTVQWSAVSGPGTVVFGDATAVDTTATFTETGSYVLRLTATDGSLSKSDDVKILVQGSVAGGTIAVFGISTGSDDAEESSSGSMSLTSGDLELVHDSTDQTVGLRFNGLTIPQGATILEAFIQFVADETQSEATSLTISGQKADSAATFTSSSTNISTRARTTASADWSPDPWTSVGDAGPLQQTPDLSSIVQEIVDRSGWTSGNSMAFILRGTGHRTAVAYEGSPSSAPKLSIVYSAPTNLPPTVNAGADQTLASPQSASLSGSASDDGIPGALTTTWSLVSGPSSVTFADSSQLATTVSLPSTGTYVIRLTADDGAKTSSDELTIVVGSTSSGSIDVRVRSSSDDAEESSSGSMSLTSGDLELVVDGSTTQKVGLRFTGLTIPRGATIVAAYVQFTVDEAQSTSTSLAIRGQAADNAAAFSSATNNVSSRTTTSATVNWSPATWSTIGQAGSAQRTPELKTIVQEIVNRSNWSPGNSLVVLITGSGHRTAVAFDGSASKAPLLHIEYQ